MKGKTKSGFEYELAADHLDDMEIIELFGELEDNGLLLPKILNKLLGKKQKEALYDHVRTKDGKVPITLIDKELEDIFAQNAIKNS